MEVDQNIIKRDLNRILKAISQEDVQNQPDVRNLLNLLPKIEFIQ